MFGGDGSGNRGRGGLLFAVKKLLHNPSFFRSRGENDLSVGSPRKNSSSSSSIQRGTLSPSQSSLLSEESLTRNAGNELGSDIERMSLTNSEDGLPNSVSQFMLPLMNNVSTADEDSQQGHNQTTSASPDSSCTPRVSRNSSISSGALMNNVSSDDEDSQQGHNQTTTASPASSCNPRVSRNSSISSGALMNNVSSADEDSQQGHNQTTSASPVSSCTPRVSRNSSISSGAFQGEGSSPSHPRSCYGESLPIIAGNEQGFDIERMPLKRSEDGLANSVSQFSTFPLMNNVSSADEDSQQGHNQTTSASPVSSCTPRVSRNSSISSGALMNNVSSADEDSQQGHNQTTSASPVSSCTLRVSRNSSISSGAFQGEGLFPSHPRSCSGESLPISAEDRLRSLGYRSMSSASYFSMPPSGYSVSSVHYYSHQGYTSVSPLSTTSLGSLRQSSIHSSVIQRESSSPSHPHLSSDESLSGFVRYVLSSEEFSGNGSISSVNYFSVASSSDEESYLGHHQTSSALSNLHNSSFSCAAIGDGNEVYYFLSPVGLRSHLQSILRRACESLVPRMVSSSATEARAYRAEVENHVKKLVEDLQVTSTDVLRNAAAELQLLASLNMDNQILIANHGAISLLINLLHSVDTKLQESAVIALLHLSTNDNNKCMIVDADAIEPLIHVLSTGSLEARETSVATLFSLSVIEEYKVKICGAIKALVKLLAYGTFRGTKDAVTALYYLSILDENKYRIVQAGAVKHLIKLMYQYPDVGMVDEAVCVLSNLSSIFEGSSEICQEGGIPLLVEILKLRSSRAKEDAAVALLQLCTDNRRCCKLVLRLGAVPPLIELSHCSNPRARQLVRRLLNHLREYCIRKGLMLTKDWLALSRDSSEKSVNCFSVSLYTNTVSSPDEDFHLHHNQTTPVSSEKSTLNVLVPSHSSASFGFPSTIETRRKSFKLSKVEKLFRISYSHLHKATEGFCYKNLIGSGSFGTVYRGKLEQGGEQTFAVKVLDLLKNGASMSFHSECEVLRNIRHRNLVPILTCCSSYDFDGNEFKALVYKFMENGNLDTWLHTHSAARTNVLSALQRLNIAIEVASALDYLHNDCEPPVIHYDLKPSNIFLDKDLTAHVGDFGSSRFYSPTIEDSSGEQSSTAGLKGSIGYAPPEYGTGAKATTYGDVYSYGIFLLEMFTAKRPTDDLFNEECCSLYEYVAAALLEQVMKIVDPLLLAYLESNHGWDKMLDNDRNLVKIKESEMNSFFLSIFKIGLSCASTSPLDRAPMKDVTSELQKIKKGLLYKNKQTRSVT